MAIKKKTKPPFALKMMRYNIRVLTFLSPPLAARLVNYLWFKTRRSVEPGREQQILATAKWQALNVESNKIQLYVWGQENKPAVLLVHGWNGRGGQLGSFAQTLTERGFRVIAFDAPGHGRSSASSTNLPEISRVIQRIIQEYGPFKAGIAHSFGGLSLMLAISEGAEIEKVVCIASAFNAERLVQAFARILQIQPKIIERHKKLLEQQFGETMWERFSMTEIVKNLLVSGLIIHDEKDEDVPVWCSKEIAQDWDNSELVLTMGLGHRRILRDKEVIKKVTAFIANE